VEQELSHDKIRDQIVVFHDATPDSGDRRYTINSRRCMGPHTQEQRHVVLAMMIIVMVGKNFDKKKLIKFDLI
jgi:hypothetical protein